MKIFSLWTDAKSNPLVIARLGIVISLCVLNCVMPHSFPKCTGICPAWAVPPIHLGNLHCIKEPKPPASALHKTASKDSFCISPWCAVCCLLFHGLGYCAYVAITVVHSTYIK